MSSKQVRVVLKKLGQPPKHFMTGASLAELQALVGGYIQVVSGSSLGLPDGIEVYMDEEGKMKGRSPNLSLWGGRDVAVGDVVFVGGTDEGGSRTLNSDEQKAIFDFCEANELGGATYGGD